MNFVIFMGLIFSSVIALSCPNLSGTFVQENESFKSTVTMTQKEIDGVTTYYSDIIEVWKNDSSTITSNYVMVANGQPQVIEDEQERLTEIYTCQGDTLVNEFYYEEKTNGGSDDNGSIRGSLKSYLDENSNLITEGWYQQGDHDRENVKMIKIRQ